MKPLRRPGIASARAARRHIKPVPRRSTRAFHIYETLLAEYGPQKWWPVTLPGRFRPEYRGKKKLLAREALEIAVGAILTQNTSWKNVERAVENLNRAGFFDDPSGFAASRLKKLVRPAGYYNQKARYLKIFLDYLKKNFGGEIKNLLAAPGAELREKLLGLKGIGRETADSIMLYAAHKPVFVVDAYTIRMMTRAGLSGAGGYEKTREFFEQNLPRSSAVYAEYHALVVRLAKERCFKRDPDCAGCALSRARFCRGDARTLSPRLRQ